MQALGSTCCRPSLCRGYRRLWMPSVARSFHAARARQKQDEEGSRDPVKLDPEAYSQMQIDPDSKTVTTAVGTLPLSPILDPSFHEARQRFTMPKQPPGKSKTTKFQRLLARNPYARALAGPVRRCPISSVNLPKFFLQRFTLVSHPGTQDPWFVPQDLDRNPKAAASAEHEPGSEPAEAIQQRREGIRTGPSAYVLSRQKLLQEIQRPQSQYHNDHKRLLRMSDHGQAQLGPVLNRAVWAKDMDKIVLELMRRRAVEALLHFASMVEKQGRKYIVKCERFSDAKSLKHRGCLLYLGRQEEASTASSESSSSESDPEFVPPRLSTMDIEGVRFGRKLAVHNLQILLGEEHVSRLRTGSELLRSGSLFLLGRQATVKLQMLLWKLQGYMVWEEQPGAPPSDSSEE